MSSEASNRFWRGVDLGPQPSHDVIVTRMNELFIELIRRRERDEAGPPPQREQEARRRAALQAIRGRW